MRAVEIQGSFGLENLLITERPMPEPGHGQVLIRVKAVSLNYRDLMMINGLYNPRQPLPLIPLSDGMGEVVAVGPGVQRVKVGARVAGQFIQKWLDGPFSKEVQSSTLGGPLDGCLTEYMVLDQQGVVPIPDFLSDEQAATLPCAALTAWNALFAQGNLKPGESVLLLGTGGVSLFALQFAKMAGAWACITSSSDDKLERAKTMGADATINYRTQPDWHKEVARLTAQRGVDHVVEVGGGETIAQSLSAVRIGGMVHLIGVLSGVMSKLPLTTILMKHVRLQGVFVGSRTMFEEMNRAIEHHKILPVVDHQFAFEDYQAAFALLQQGRHFGKIVIRMG